MMSALHLWAAVAMVGFAAASTLDLRAASWSDVLLTEPAGYTTLPGAPFTNDELGSLHFAPKSYNPNGRSHGWGFTKYTIPLPVAGSVSFLWSMNGAHTYCGGPAFGFAPAVSTQNLFRMGACTPFCTTTWTWSGSQLLVDDAHYNTTLYIANDRVSRTTWGPDGEVFSAQQDFVMPPELRAANVVHIHIGIDDAYAKDDAALSVYEVVVSESLTCAQQETDLQAQSIRFQQKCSIQKMEAFLAANANRCRKNAGCDFWECDDIPEVDVADHC